MKRLQCNIYLYSKIFSVILLKIFLLFLSFTTFHSCCFSDPYPTTWSKVIDNQKYGDSIVSGIYKFNGDESNRYNYKCPFDDLIKLPGFKSSFSTDSIDNVIINLIDKETLIIILRSKSDTVYKTVFPDNGEDFSLTDDGVELKGQTSNGGDWGLAIPISSGRTVTLMKNSGGSLIVKSDYSSFGLLLLIPVWGSTSTWYKFSKY